MISTASYLQSIREASMKMPFSMTCLWDKSQNNGESAGKVYMI